MLFLVLWGYFMDLYVFQEENKIPDKRFLKGCCSESYSSRTEGQQLYNYVKDGIIVIGSIYENPELLEVKNEREK